MYEETLAAADLIFHHDFTPNDQLEGDFVSVKRI